MSYGKTPAAESIRLFVHWPLLDRKDKGTECRPPSCQLAPDKFGKAEKGGHRLFDNNARDELASHLTTSDKIEFNSAASRISLDQLLVYKSTDCIVRCKSSSLVISKLP